MPQQQQPGTGAPLDPPWTFPLEPTTKELPGKKKVGRQTFAFEQPPSILAAASVVGPKEGQGPLGHHFDVVKKSEIFGQKSWERAEAKLLQEAAQLAMDRAKIQTGDVDVFLAGDLLDQITCANMAARELSIPLFGLFAACATLTEGLTLGAMAVDGGFASRVLVGCCSHHETAERLYREPTEHAAQRPPTAQWTVTGAGCFILAGHDAAGRAAQTAPAVTHATVGRVVDMGLKNPFELGAAMAPAAADTISRHFEDTGRGPEDYDLIVTGDLSDIGSRVAEDLLSASGVDISDRYADCGEMIYDRKKQGVQAGASGCGCSATVFAGVLLPRMQNGELRRVLLACTGALFSPTTFQQGESIPCIAHAVAVEMPGQGGIPQ